LVTSLILGLNTNKVEVVEEEAVEMEDVEEAETILVEEEITLEHLLQLECQPLPMWIPGHRRCHRHHLQGGGDA